jgi:hypothetical protein
VRYEKEIINFFLEKKYIKMKREIKDTLWLKKLHWSSWNKMNIWRRWVLHWYKMQMLSKNISLIDQFIIKKFEQLYEMLNFQVSISFFYQSYSKLQKSSWLRETNNYLNKINSCKIIDSIFNFIIDNFSKKRCDNFYSWTKSIK